MYKDILVAVDASDTSTQALNEAIKLTQEQQATLHIVHVTDEQYTDYAGIGIDYHVYELEMQKVGQKILNESAAVARHSNVKFDTK